MGVVDFSFLPAEAFADMSGIEPPCSECGKHFSEGAWMPGADETSADNVICKECCEPIISELEAEAQRYAEENVKITETLPVFDPSTSWTITPDEYAMGDRVSNTENAYRTRCRHDYTNYDSLIALLEKHDQWDEIEYRAIRNRADELVDEEIEKNDLIRCDLEDDCESDPVT